MSPVHHPPYHTRIPGTRVRFFSFSKSNDEDIAVFRWTGLVAHNENRPFADVEKEFKEKLGRHCSARGNFPYEIWGPPELADRINDALERQRLEIGRNA